MTSEGPPLQDESAPFNLICSGCGADVNALDKEFVMGNFAFPPHADYAIFEVRCLTCETSIDLGLWLVNKEKWLKEFDPDGKAREITPDAVAVLDRYLKMVEDHRQQWEAFYSPQVGEDPPAIDFSAIDLDLSDERWLAVPAQVLAAARGMRKVVGANPGESPRGFLRVGQFNCLLSFDTAPFDAISDLPLPYALHLSIMKTLAPGRLPQAEEAFLLSLFYVPGERPFLRAQPGQTIPVVHYYLGADVPELNEC